MTKEDFLIMIVRAALWNNQLHGQPVPHRMFKEIMTTAEKQTVTGLLLQVFVDPKNGVKLEKLDAVEAYSSMRDIQDRNHKVNDELKALTLLLESYGIRFVVVKGQTLAALYPEPLARTAGDIDFYVWPEDFVRAKEIIEKAWNVEYETDEEDDEQDQHIAFSHEGIEFEMHFLLMKFSSGKVQKAFDQMIAESKPCSRNVEGVDIPVLSPEAELIYTFLHAFHHFIEIGIGLRQIGDIAILLNEEMVDKAKVKYWLKALDFERGFRAFEAICVDKLRLNESCLPLAIDGKDREEVDKILDIVFTRGNFGKYGRKNEVRSGLNYYIETFKMKVGHYLSFYRLCPTEAKSTLFLGIPKKIVQAFKR